MTGKVITFYSYKGGTGRTMALANAAVVLAQRPTNRVLMIDWDLEAPGLHRFFPRSQTTTTEEPGLIELMSTLRDRIEADGLDAHDEPATRELIRQLPLDDFVTPLASEHLGDLSVIYAGRMSDPAYASRVNTFAWERLHERAPYLFKAFAHELAERYEHVMIDSRTGVTDTGGICTMLLPEKLVMVFTPNRQSLLGVVDRSENAVRYRQQAEDLRPLTIFPLASRVELSQEPLRHRWRHGGAMHEIEGYQPMFERLFCDIYGLAVCDLKSYFDDVQIQHVPYYSYGEEIAVLDSDAPRDRLSLRTSYEHVARSLDRVQAPWERGPANRREHQRLHFNVPLVVSDFTGRERERDAIEEFLRDEAPGLKTTSMTGLPGVGKTQIAARCVQQELETYDIVAWIDVEDDGVADLCRLAATLDVETEGLPPRAQADAALLRLSESAGRWLLVLDGVLAPKQLDSCCPRSGDGRILITSRHRGLAQAGAVMTIDVFDLTTATAYLMARAGQPGTPLPAARLAAALGCLPLALSHAGAYCAKGTSFREYLQLLATLPADTLFESDPDVARGQTPATVWQTSIVAAGSDAPLALPVLGVAAYAAPVGIPKALFEVLLEDDGPEQRKRLSDAFNALVMTSLAHADGSSVSVHPLLQKVLRDDFAARDDDRAARRSLAALSHAFPEDVSLPANWPGCEQLLPHVRALADGFSDPGSASAEMIDLLNRACLYVIWADPGDRSLTITQDTLRRAESILGIEHPATLTARRSVALASLQVGHIQDAVGILEPLVGDEERLLGAEHPARLNTLNDLASAYQDAGRAFDALVIYEPLLADVERILGAEHPDALNIRSNLASAYGDAGRTTDAIAIYQPLLSTHERILGAEHPATLTTRNNLAHAYQDAGRTTDAIAIYQPLLSTHERILGAEHPATLTTRNNLASAYQDGGRTTDAIAIYEPLLSTHERILGAEHPATLTTRNNLASAYQSAGRRSDAIAIYERLLGDQKRILGLKHPNTLTTRSNLANAYRNAGRTNDAIAVSGPRREPPGRL